MTVMGFLNIASASIIYAYLSYRTWHIVCCKLEIFGGHLPVHVFQLIRSIMLKSIFITNKKD